MLNQTHVVAKYSGDPFVDPARAGEVESFAKDVVELRDDIPGQLVVCVGGGAGNRGRDVADDGMTRVRADQTGMLASIANAARFAEIVGEGEVLGFRSLPMHLVEAGLPREDVERIREFLTYESCGEVLIEAAFLSKKIIVAGGGIGFGGVSTDSGAANWATNLTSGSDKVALLKGTSVPYVFTADPKVDANAQPLKKLSYEFCVANRLGVIDEGTWVPLRNSDVTTRIYQNAPGNIIRAYHGEIGSIIDNTPMAESYRAN